MTFIGALAIMMFIFVVGSMVILTVDVIVKRNRRHEQLERYGIPKKKKEFKLKTPEDWE